MKRLGSLLLLLLQVLIALTVPLAPLAGYDVSAATPDDTQAARQAVAARGEVTVATVGEPSALRIEHGALTFCDKRGARKLNLQTGRDAPYEKPCAHDDEPNTACAGFDIEVSVRAPLSEPNDIVDLDSGSVPLHGRVHDCAVDGNTLVVVTASSVVLVDVARAKPAEISHQGGDRVAVGSGWIAWSSAATLHLEPVKMR